MLEWRKLPQGFIDYVSVNGDVVGSESWFGVANALNASFMNCLYCKVIVTDMYIITS